MCLYQGSVIVTSESNGRTAEASGRREIATSIQARESTGTDRGQQMRAHD